MIVRQQVIDTPNDQGLPAFNQLYNQSCLAVCLDLLIYDQTASMQNRWNNHREQYSMGKLQNLNVLPAPNKEEVAQFLAHGFYEAPNGFRHFQVPEPAMDADEKANFLAQLNQILNTSDIIILALVGHARIYFRNEQKLFTPGMAEGEGSMMMHFDAGTINIQINENNQFYWDGEVTPMILICNYPRMWL